MAKRTYELQSDTIEWIDKFSSEANVDKSEVVDRAVRVYAAKMATGEWEDPRFKDVVDKKFRRVIGRD